MIIYLIIFLLKCKLCHILLGWILSPTDLFSCFAPFSLLVLVFWGKSLPGNAREYEKSSPETEMCCTTYAPVAPGRSWSWSRQVWENKFYCIFFGATWRASQQPGKCYLYGVSSLSLPYWFKKHSLFFSLFRFLVFLWFVFFFLQSFPAFAIQSANNEHKWNENSSQSFCFPLLDIFCSSFVCYLHWGVEVVVGAACRSSLAV